MQLCSVRVSVRVRSCVICRLCACAHPRKSMASSSHGVRNLFNFFWLCGKLKVCVDMHVYNLPLSIVVSVEYAATHVDYFAVQL